MNENPARENRADDDDRVLITLSASAPRRFFALAVLLVLGGLLAWLGIAAPGMALWIRLLLMAGGGVTLWLALRLREATGRRLELTRAELRESSGRVLAPIGGIGAVSRGTFALKPSHGFTLILKEPAPPAWAPGLWWRLGRRIGIGGVTSAGQAKAMAELITILLQERGQERGADKAEG